MHQVFIVLKALHHKTTTLESREVTKLHYCDSTSSKRRVLKLRTINHAHIHELNNLFGEQQNPRFLYLKERRCLNVSTKEDRQPRNRLSLLFHLSPANLPSTNVQEVYFVHHKISLTVL